MDMVQILLITALVEVLIVGAYFLFNGPSASKESERRLMSLRIRHSDNPMSKMETQLKKAIASRKPNAYALAGSGSRAEALALRLDRTGKGWTVQKYMQVSLGLAGVVGLLILIKSGSLVLSLGLGLLVGAGLPHFVVSRAIKKRTADFNARFPDAIELLVRGLRSGLPVTETLSVVAAEVPGAVGTEFRQIVERTRIGKSLDESLQETADKLNIPEFKFFCITLAIQRETGGNLAETLSNLADVLRKRVQMKLKIRAMSSESKASAYIVGALPFCVFIMIYMVNPDYLKGFFSEERLIVTGLGGLTWMGIGAFIMSRMVSFEI